MLSLILSVSALSFPCMIPAGLAAAAPSAEAALLGGAIVSIDQEALTLTIFFPTGESRAPLSATLACGMASCVGDHVTFEFNQEQAVIKPTKLPTDPAH